MVVESILPNQIKWSWYHSLQKTMLYLMKSKYAIFSNIKVMKIEHSAFLGHPVYNTVYWHLGNSYRYMTQYSDKRESANSSSPCRQQIRTKDLMFQSPQLQPHNQGISKWSYYSTLTMPQWLCLWPIMTREWISFYNFLVSHLDPQTDYVNDILASSLSTGSN